MTATAIEKHCNFNCLLVVALPSAFKFKSECLTILLIFMFFRLVKRSPSLIYINEDWNPQRALAAQFQPKMILQIANPSSFKNE